MTDPEPKPLLARARVRDLLRPTRLYDGIDARPTFILPTMLLVASAALYMEVAADVVLPSLVSSMLDRSLVTESSLRRTFHLSLLAGSFFVPMFWVPLGAFGTWLTLRFARARPPYPLLVSLLAYSALWMALGFLVKAVIVWSTGNPAPSTNLGALFRPEGHVARAVVAMTNPFLVASVVWTARGLRHWGTGPVAAWLGGAAPWAATAVVFATLFAGERGLAISAPVPVDDWPTVTAGVITMRHAPELAGVAEDVARDMDGFSRQIAGRFGFEARPLRVYLYADHATLERAIGERLHVLTTGSIRGSDLVYVEMPGQNAAVTNERGRRNMLRFAGLMQLAPATARAPRWFVEGMVHATVEPGTPELDREFRAALRRIGLPSLDALMPGTAFHAPEGALLARSLVDHIAATHGPPALVETLRDVVKGSDFRDALFARTRLTASELEAGWQDNLKRVLEEERAASGGSGEAASGPLDPAKDGPPGQVRAEDEALGEE